MSQMIFLNQAVHILNKINTWTQFILKWLPLFSLHLNLFSSHRTWTTKTILVCPTKTPYLPKRELLNGHPFIHINGPVYTHIIFYDSYRKWTPHYSFISWSHKNNQAIERLKFKESLWEYLSPHTPVLFCFF